MSSDRQSKTEKPTPKKMKEARKNGQIPKSTEFVSWSSVLVASFVMPFAFSKVADSITNLQLQAAVLIEKPNELAAVDFLGEGLKNAGIVLAPLVGALVVTIFATSVSQTGLVFSTKKLKPSFKSFNVLKGLKKLFGPQGIWETIKTLVKVSIITYTAYQVYSTFIPHLIQSGRLDLFSIIGYTGSTTLHLVRQVAMTALALAGVDYAWNRRQVMKNLKMSKQEITEEYKSMEGDPLMKQKRKIRMREMSRLRMMAAIASADAVIVNPTHIAVVIKYKLGSGAPRVVAKGIGVTAERIRDKAEEHHIPLVKDIPLARTLYKICEIDDEVPAALYEAVAKVLAFIYSLRKTGKTSYGGIHKMPLPTVSLDMAESLAAVHKGGSVRRLPELDAADS